MYNPTFQNYTPHPMNNQLKSSHTFIKSTIKTHIKFYNCVQLKPSYKILHISSNFFVAVVIKLYCQLSHTFLCNSAFVSTCFNGFQLIVTVFRWRLKLTKVEDKESLDSTNIKKIKTTILQKLNKASKNWRI